MRGQLDFQGREVQQVTMIVPGLGSVPVDLDKEEWDPIPGDWLEVTMRLVVNGVGPDEDHDRQGIGSSPFGIKIRTKAMDEGFAITNILRWGKRQEAFDKDHGAVG